MTTTMLATPQALTDTFRGKARELMLELQRRITPQVTWRAEDGKLQLTLPWWRPNSNERLNLTCQVIEDGKVPVIVFRLFTGWPSDNSSHYVADWTLATWRPEKMSCTSGLWERGKLQSVETMLDSIVDATRKMLKTGLY